MLSPGMRSSPLSLSENKTMLLCSVGGGAFDKRARHMGKVDKVSSDLGLHVILLRSERVVFYAISIEARLP